MLLWLGESKKPFAKVCFPLQRCFVFVCFKHLCCGKPTFARVFWLSPSHSSICFGSLYWPLDSTVVPRRHLRAIEVASWGHQDGSGPHKQWYFLGNIDTFGIEHISSTHVCELKQKCSISKVAIFHRYWAPFGDWSVHQWVPSWSWRTNLGPFETLGSPLRTLTRPAGDPVDPQKQYYFLGNIDTFGIEHISSTHVCELKKNAQSQK